MVVIQGDNNDNNLTGLPSITFLAPQFGNDIIYGLGGNDTLTGLSGDDTLHAGSGDDKLEGNNGNDFLISGEGLDTLNGGSGSDTFKLNNSSLSFRFPDSIIEDFDPNQDQIQLPGSSSDYYIIGQANSSSFRLYYIGNDMGRLYSDLVAVVNSTATDDANLPSTSDFSYY